MGFASRSVSVMRYRVKGNIDGSFWDSIHDGVKRVVGVSKHHSLAKVFGHDGQTYLVWVHGSSVSL